MNRSSLIGGCVVCGIAAFVVSTRRAESGAADAMVRLQQTSPGVQQTGNSNLNGTVKAAQFQGGGAGLSGLHWANISDAPTTLLALPYDGYAGSGGVAFRIDHVVGGTAIIGQNDLLGAGQSIGVLGNASGQSGIGLFGRASDPSGFTYGVYGEASSTNGNGVYGFSNASSGFANGMRAQTTSPGGNGIYAINSSSSGVNSGVYSTAASVNGRGVTGICVASSGTNYGVYGQSFSTSGRGVYGLSRFIGVLGQSNDPNGAGVVAESLSSSGNGPGLEARSLSPTGLAAYLDGRIQVNDNSSFGGVPGGSRLEVYANTANNESMYVNNLSGGGAKIVAQNGTAVWAITTNGFAGLDARNASSSGFGVYGEVGATSGTTYGVFGNCGSGAGYAVWANGRFAATGTKSFQIDHPLDPENKYLVHYCVEGPEPQNMCNGTITTDSVGEARVQLPDYYEQINRDPRIQLTVDDESDDFVMVKSSGGIQDGSFRIRTSKPSVKVYWEVKAVRNDLWVQKYGAPVEMDKPQAERGKYQHPELYGYGQDRAIHPILGTASASKLKR